MDHPLILIGVVLLIGAICGYIAWRQAAKRREELGALAAELGWRFDPRRDRRHDDEYAHFEIFRRGHDRFAYNTLSGKLAISGRPHQVKAGDFSYEVTSGSGKSRSSRTYRFSYLIVHLSDLEVPDLLIRPEGILDKLAGIFGFADINFESAEFSRRFHVRSPDRKFAYDVCDARMMEFLLATRPPAIDIERNRCSISDGSSLWRPQQFREHMRWVVRFFGLWPEHVKARWARK
jgi:hypothetical protein